jgi:hypothetical protein
MAGGAGNVGSAGGMGNASAQPQGGPFGGGMAQPYNSGAPRQSTNQSTFGQGMNTMFGGGSPFGLQQQQPMQNPFGGQQQGPIQQDMSSMGQLGAPNQMPQPMGQRPAYMDNPDFQAYQRQEQDLGRQMDEYVKKAPMYQQLQDLQGKMRGFQQPQGQMQNPYGDINQMQQQRNMQDQARQQQMWQQATQDDMRAALGHPPLSSSKMGMPDYGSEQVAPEFGNFGERRMGGGFGRRGMGGGYGQQMPQQAMGLQGLYSMLQGRRGGPFGGY